MSTNTLWLAVPSERDQVQHLEGQAFLPATPPQQCTSYSQNFSPPSELFPMPGLGEKKSTTAIQTGLFLSHINLETTYVWM